MAVTQPEERPDPWPAKEQGTHRRDRGTADRAGTSTGTSTGTAAAAPVAAALHHRGWWSGAPGKAEQGPAETRSRARGSRTTSDP